MPLLTTQDVQQINEFKKSYPPNDESSSTAANCALYSLRHEWMNRLGKLTVEECQQELRRTLEILNAFQGLLSRLHPQEEKP